MIPRRCDDDAINGGTMLEVRNRRIIVTGASSGIGLDAARLLHSAGAEVCLVARRAEVVAGIADELGERAWSYACDVSEEAHVEALAESAEEHWGGVDGLVNNAGVAPMATLDATDLATWERTFAVNVRGPYLLCRALGPMLKKGTAPAVVNVSSSLATRAIPGMAAYNASKAALNHLTRALALEWAPTVRVNAVMPAVVDTPIHDGRGMSRDDIDGMGAIHPLGRIGQPRDISSMILYLLSDEAAWMTGTIIPVDGGMTAA
jgi:NAD(P)-dependent dehydrogenase (short-subunit alcohol dehydrogenase family)